MLLVLCCVCVERQLTLRVIVERPPGDVDFGIQEGHVYPPLVHEIFPGTPEIAAGYATPSTAPGWGIEIDERLAAKHPPVYGGFERWAITVRRPDGALEPP